MRHMTYSAMFLALALILPFLTGQIPQIGSALLPMHLPVLLCGFICGPFWGAVVGFAAPILRGVIFGMPPLFPTGIAMAIELLTYGLVCGLLYRCLKGKKWNILISLLCAMCLGRLVWGIVRVIMAGLSQSSFTWAIFLAGAFTNAIPGILLQIVLIPVLVKAIERAGLTL